MQRKSRASGIRAVSFAAVALCAASAGFALEPAPVTAAPVSLSVAGLAPGQFRMKPTAMRLEAPQLAIETLVTEAAPGPATAVELSSEREDVTDVPAPAKRPAWQLRIDRIARRGLPFLRLGRDRSDGKQYLFGVNRDGYLGVFTAADDGRTPEPLIR